MEDKNQNFKLSKKMTPQGSQPEAIKKLVENYRTNKNFQTLLGVTGSGKTFTMANVIANLNRPTIVIAHNKTLAAQLYEEFKEFFPEDNVEYFVSYYDYYQPESYIPSTDQYIEKDSAINQRIEQMRLASTASLMTKKNTIVVASVSCIYGLGNPENFEKLGFEIKVGDKIDRKELLKKFVKIYYERNDMDLTPGKFRVKGDTIDFIPAYYNDIIRIEMFENEIERITKLDKITSEVMERINHIYVYPSKHYAVLEEDIEPALESIKEQLEEDLKGLNLLEAHRLKQRTLNDIDMIKETGYCKGIENYSRHFDFRKVGEKPYCLLDYFPDDFLIIIDESHQTLPQIHGMYKGDKARKKNLIDYGFRLTSAYDNRPLKFEEFEKYMQKNKIMCVSATPGDYEKSVSDDIVEQIIRPTGLIDPIVEIKPTKNQMEDLKNEIRISIEKGNRCFVTTLTKRLAEDLAEYLSGEGIKTRYLHSEIDTLERTELIRELRLGKFDCLVGINLLREGLDVPEVGFVGILDADKEGFLRNDKSLIQTIGRAARNIDSRVVLYADVMTDSIKAAMSETERRRKIQIKYNEEHKITPQTIVKPVKEKEVEITDIKSIPKSEIPNVIIELKSEMDEAAENLDFEKAILIRNRIQKLEERVRGKT